MGETDADIVDVALSLRSLGVDSIPVNFLIPIPGTPLEGRDELDPRRCLKILALMRFTCPAKEIRVAGGRELITAFVAATEVVLRIGSATQHSNEIRGFHAPGTTGPFGAAVGVGKLLGFDESKMTNALGIAASLSCGLVQFSRSGTGGMVKRLHFGRANESGVLAANLAERGFTGPHDIIEGEFGFLRVFCNEFDMSKLTAGLGESFLTMTIYMKRFACHGAAQGQLQALQELQAEHSFSAEDINSIDVEGHHEMLDRHNIPEPKDAMIAQYSVPFAIALAFFRDPKDPRSFDQSAVEDPRIIALCKRVRLHREEGAGHMTPGATVTLTLNDGRVLKRRVVYFKGTPQSPAGRDDVYEKFQLLTRDCPRQGMDEIFERLHAERFHLIQTFVGHAPSHRLQRLPL